jgi:PilZ domain-containing protein
MAETIERRRVARITVPSQIRGTGLENREVRLLDLSSDGARIAQEKALQPGAPCALILPPALGPVRLPARIIWSRLSGGEQTLEGERVFLHQSGLAFRGLTPEEQTALADALTKLKAAQRTPDSTPPR